MQCKLVAGIALSVVVVLAGSANAALMNPLSGANGYEDSGDYTISEIAQSVTRINGTGTVQNTGDDGEEDVSIGFSFDFFGTTYTDIQLNGNGHIYLGTGSFINGAHSNSAHPEANGGSMHTNYSGPVIALFWEDLNENAGGEYYTETRGTAGSHEFVVELDGVHTYSNNGVVTAQLILHEGSNDITMHYITYAPVDTRNGVAIGVQGGTTEYLQYGWFPNGNETGMPADGESLRFSVPEPTTMLLLGIGGLAALRRRRTSRS